MAIPAPSQAPVPRHIAIIMDGNGRWAKQRMRPRTFGHHEGVEALRRTVQAAADLGIGYLTVYGFSTENWRRPAEEVSALMDLMRLYVSRDLERLAKDNVRIRIAGARDGLQDDIFDIIQNTQKRTATNTGLNLTIAFNYGGQDEIVRAARRIAEEAARGALQPKDIDANLFAAHLDTAGLPPVDLLIRTSGEYRLSNFMLWQAAYAEFVFIDTLWPDFDKDALQAAICEYQRRDRRYGGSEPNT